MSAQRYLVTARKYRPQLFHELVAQEHVTETLKNAIRLDRLAHAYLFSGPRGVGKTTAARILAKAINCTTPREERDAQAEPCRSCDSCRTFEQGRSLNIIEIDAASNNRVDDIRDLRETVRIPPQGGRKKVYIVDEVHMLSTAAFNALLKTLEEPPPHVLFIFATTEPHKVLATILSRCQRFDFRRIAVPEIVARLETICAEEEITADEAALMLIARKGDGALRDALSVFDQAVSLCGTNISYADLAQALGVVDVDRYFDVTDRIVTRDTAGMLRLVEDTVRAGHDLQEFLAGLAEHLRNMLVAQTMEDAGLIEAAESTRRRYREASETMTEADLLRLLTLAADAEDAIKGSTQPRLKVEIVLLKMASISLGADLREAIRKIERLEELAQQGNLPSGTGEGQGGAPTPASTPKGGDRPRSPASVASGKATKRESDVSPSADAGAGTSSADEAARSSRAGSAKRTTRDDSAAGTSSADATSRTRGASDASPSGNGSASKDGAAADSPEAGPNRSIAGTSEMPEIQSAASSSSVLPTPELRRRSSAAPETALAEEDQPAPNPTNAGPIDGIWPDLLEQVKNDKIQVWSLLHHTKPEGFDNGVVHVAVPNDFHRRVLTGQSDYVLEHLRPLAEDSVRSLQFTVREAMGSSAVEETASEFDPYEYMKRKRQENPVVRAIFEQFGGELVW